MIIISETQYNTIFVAVEPDENPEDGNNPEDEDYGGGVPNEDGGITY